MSSSQTKVGLIILAAFIVTLGVVVNLGKVHIKRGYEIYIVFSDLADLPQRAAVRISGVNVGRISAVELLPDFRYNDS